MSSVRSATDKVVTAVRATASDRLVRNAGWMWVNLGVSSVLGMVGWIIAARLYSPGQVGAVSATAAAATFVSTVAGLGLMETTIRHLQGVENQRRFVTRISLLVSLAGLVGGIGWWVLTHHLLQEEGVGGWATLGILCGTSVAATSGAITDGVIIAVRRPALMLFENTAGGLVRLSAIALVSLGALGLLLSWAVAAVVTTLVSFYVVYRLLDLRSMGGAQVPRAHVFAASNWISGIASLVPPGITPLLIASTQGAKAAGWVAIPMLATPWLNAVPSRLARSLFAEASKTPEHLVQLFWQVLPRALALTAVTSGVLALSARFVLALFGSDYAAHSTTLLQLLALASFVSVPNHLADVVLNVRRDALGFAGANVLGSGVWLAAVVVAMHGSPTDIGWAWVVGTAAYGAISCAIVLQRRHRGDLFATDAPV